MYAVSELEGLAVVTETRDARSIQEDLTRLDPGLFLDMERAYPGGPICYVVKEHVASGHPPGRVVEWQDEHGNPLPLSSGLIERVKRAGYRPATEIVAEAIAWNERKRERQRESSAADYDAVVQDHKKRLNPIYSPLLRPRFRDAGGRPL